MNPRRAPASRSARRVSTVYEGPGRSSSARSTAKPGEPASASIQHRGALLRRGAVEAALERLLPRRHEPERIEARALPGRDPADDQVAMVNGVERSAEQADHGP